ncbi:MAG TPA: hypothetical protein VFQ67_10055 [Allosphingosinicella sp.]|jgi:hypothetical protein|nr:hypothetical protein [Allosphingosinicella sp.]
MDVLLLMLLAAAGPPASGAAEPAPVAGKVICKTETRIGSLAGRKRVCHTAAEWQKIAARGRQTWEEVQGAHGSSHSVEPPGQMTSAPQ